MRQVLIGAALGFGFAIYFISAALWFGAIPR